MLTSQDLLLNELQSSRDLDSWESLKGFLIFICPTTEEKWLDDILRFMPYLDKRFV